MIYIYIKKNKERKRKKEIKKNIEIIHSFTKLTYLIISSIKKMNHFQKKSLEFQSPHSQLLLFPFSIFILTLLVLSSYSIYCQSSSNPPSPPLFLLYLSLSNLSSSKHLMYIHSPYYKPSKHRTSLPCNLLKMIPSSLSTQKMIYQKTSNLK